VLVFYICIPVHNEERTVGVLLWKIRSVMGELGRDYEVLVLDDGSTDSTPDVLTRYRRSLPLRLFRNERREGYAAALDRLLREAVERAPYPKRDAAITLQGDFTEHPDHLVPLIKTFEGGADVVTGVVAPGTRVGPLPLRVARWMADRIIAPVRRGAPVSDLTCGFRVYRVVVLRKALREVGDRPLLTRHGWASNAELLGVAVRHARRVEEVPVSPRYDMRLRESRFRIVPALRELSALRRQWVRGGGDWTVRGDAA